MREYERRSRWTPWHVLAILLILGVLVAGVVLVYRLTERPGDSRPGDVAAGPTPTASAPAVAPTASALNQVPPAAAPPAAAPPTAAAQAPEATPAPVTVFSPEEEHLVAGVRDDARVNCSPRRTELPEGALAGIECRPTTGPAARVGVYAFDGSDDALRAYFDRLASYGVEPETGNCWEGIPGDGFWGGDTGVDNGQNEIYRQGCFLDEDGHANLRFTGLAESVYVGIVGQSWTSIPELLEWAWAEDDGNPGIYRPMCRYRGGMLTPRERAWDDIHDLLPSGGRSARRRSTPDGVDSL